MTENQYTDGNRAFLQAIMARGAFTLSEGKSMLAAILSVQEEKRVDANEVSQEMFDSYIAAAADAVSCFEYEIHSTQHQVTKNRIYAFVNSVSDALTQIATVRTPDELLYIRRLIDAMFETNNTKRKEVMAIRSMQALESKIRKGTSEKSITQAEAEKLLTILEREKWLERSSEGFYSLAPRALIELRSWLVDTYNDSEDLDAWQKVKFCEACKEIVTVGERCSDLDCIIRLHNICEAAYWRSRPSRTCPKCKLEWKGGNFVGEKAVTSLEENLRQKGRGLKRTRPSQLDETNDDNDNEPEQGQEDVRPGSKRIARRESSPTSETHAELSLSSDGNAEDD
ncbi:Non-structural maintenance of chromosomes element 1-like protein [Golovinomyces cichoracearum]|uniref:Non-structural maintenance of chromosomes element 1 homolog n=1 Tax=Golovinomyces cichoracearum TaxID=62708 RepID=A0A420JB20_9PEZI|nr:Non-structural maintenance of chromosomes element 1-like protein [Golovinomyces cichoracearum]